MQWQGLVLGAIELVVVGCVCHGPPAIYPMSSGSQWWASGHPSVVIALLLCWPFPLVLVRTIVPIPTIIVPCPHYPFPHLLVIIVCCSSSSFGPRCCHPCIPAPVSLCSLSPLSWSWMSCCHHPVLLLLPPWFVIAFHPVNRGVVCGRCWVGFVVLLSSSSEFLV